MKPILLAIAVILAGCSTPSAGTATGKPDVMISGTPEAAKVAIMNKMVDLGFLVTKQDGALITAERENKGIMVNALFGSKFDPSTWLRHRFAIVDQSKGKTRVTDSVFLVRNRGSGFEKETELPAAYRDVQVMLEEIKRGIDGQPTSVEVAVSIAAEGDSPANPAPEARPVKTKPATTAPISTEGLTLKERMKLITDKSEAEEREKMEARSKAVGK